MAETTIFQNVQPSRQTQTLEKEDRIDEIKKKYSPPVPHLLQTKQAPVLPYEGLDGVYW